MGARTDKPLSAGAVIAYACALLGALAVIGIPAAFGWYFWKAQVEPRDETHQPTAHASK
jgi:hypothetical protein